MKLVFIYYSGTTCLVHRLSEEMELFCGALVGQGIVSKFGVLYQVLDDYPVTCEACQQSLVAHETEILKKTGRKRHL